MVIKIMDHSIHEGPLGMRESDGGWRVNIGNCCELCRTGSMGGGNIIIKAEINPYFLDMS